MNGYRDRIYQYYLSSKKNAQRIESLKESDYPYFRKLIREHFPPDRDAAILDLGCGLGTLIYCAQRAGYRNVSGVDGSPEQVAEAHRLGVEGVTEGDVMQGLRALADGSLNTVVAFDLIEHFTKDELLGLVDEVRRVLRDGGTWIIHTPNAASPLFGTIRYGDITHEQAFTPNSINQILRASQFRRVQCFEDAPIAHGLKSALRSVLWKGTRGLLKFYLAVETGTGGGRDSIFTQNFLVVAQK